MKTQRTLVKICATTIKAAKTKVFKSTHSTMQIIDTIPVKSIENNILKNKLNQISWLIKLFGGFKNNMVFNGKIHFLVES